MFGTSKITRQLIHECTILTKNIVNHLIANGIEVKTHDTLFIFQNSYCFSILSARHRITSEKQYCSITSDILLTMKDWLMEILFQNSYPEVEKEIEKVLIDLNNGYMTNWILKIIEVHSTIKQYSLDEKLEAYHDKYLNDICLHFFNEDDIEDEIAQNVWEFVARNAQKSLNILGQKNLKFL